MVILMIALGLSGCGSSGSPHQATEDAILVRCLSGGSGTQIAEAAVILDLAEPAGRMDEVRLAGRDLSIAEWRSEHPEDFRRACAAAVAADGLDSSSGSVGRSAEGGSSALLAAVLSLLAAVLAAIVGGVVTAWLRDSGRRRQLADALRHAATELERAGRRYTAGWRGEAAKEGADEVLRCVANVDAAVVKIRDAHPYWFVLGRAPEPTDPPLDQGLEQWASERRDDRTMPDQLQTAFDRRVETAKSQAYLVERPLRFWWRLRHGPLSVGDKAAW